MTRARAPEAGELLTHPWVLVLLALWAVNDHVLKAAHPGWLSGKLSDVACLAVIPALVGGAVELLRRGDRPATAWLVGAAIVAALIMALINLWTPAAWAYEQGLGALQWPWRALAAVAAGQAPPPHAPVLLTMDPSDLVTLPAALIPIALARTRERRHVPERAPQSSRRRPSAAPKKRIPSAASVAVTPR